MSAQPSGASARVDHTHLSLHRATRQLLDADLAGDHARLGALLGAGVQQWPPIGGEWDADAMRFFVGLLDDTGMAADEGLPWGSMYVVTDGRLVGSAGFFGPPDDDGEVEIGYSVCAHERRRGIATAAISALCAEADASGVGVRARTHTTNTGSWRALVRNGFVADGGCAPATDGSTDGELVTLRRPRPTAH